MSDLEIVWTKVDEAPALATYSLLPIVEAFVGAAGVKMKPSDYFRRQGYVTYQQAQPSPHFFFCDSNVVGSDPKSSCHRQREAGPADRVTPRVT